MAYYVVDGRGQGFISSDIPTRDYNNESWISKKVLNFFDGKNILGIDAKWDDDPI